MNINQLREALEDALGDTIDYEIISQTRSQLPDRGTVIIDSKVLTAVPFEVFDYVHSIGRLSSCPDRWVYCGVIMIQSIEYQSGEVWFNGGVRKLQWSLDCFATREEAEAECKKRNQNLSQEGES